MPGWNPNHSTTWMHGAPKEPMLNIIKKQRLEHVITLMKIRDIKVFKTFCMHSASYTRIELFAFQESSHCRATRECGKCMAIKMTFHSRNVVKSQLNFRNAHEGYHIDGVLLSPIATPLHHYITFHCDIIRFNCNIISNSIHILIIFNWKDSHFFSTPCEMSSR